MASTALTLLRPEWARVAGVQGEEASSRAPSLITSTRHNGDR